MDPNQFDAITRSLGTARSRRSMLRTLGAAALGAVGLAGARRADAAPGGNSACAHFCQQLPPGPQRGQCVSDAAHGTGLCYQCGPAAPGTSLTLCGTTCVDTSNDVTNCGGCGHVCPTGETCTNGQCAATCTRPGGPCDLANPGACCSLICTNFNPPAQPICF
jgi:hypothetical protein